MTIENNSYAKICTMKNQFGKWLSNELDIRGMSQADLSRAAGLDPSFISNLINGLRGPGNNAIKGIAKALYLDPKYVMQEAGILPQDNELPTETYQEVVLLFQKLSPKDQEHLLELMRVFVNAFSES